MYRKLHAGKLEVLSILTFIPEEKDDHSEVTCTAKFNGGKTSSTTLKLYVKREMISLRKISRMSLILKFRYWIYSIYAI